MCSASLSIRKQGDSAESEMPKPEDAARVTLRGVPERMGGNLGTLRGTAERAAALLLSMRRELAKVGAEEQFPGGKVEPQVRVRIQTGRKLDDLETDAHNAKAHIEQALRAVEQALPIANVAEPPPELRTVQAVRSELGVGWHRIELAIEHARAEVQGLGAMTVLPAWRRGRVVVVPLVEPS